MKSMFQSKMIWFNGLTLAAGVLIVMQDTIWVMESYGGIVLAVLGLVNLGLRMITKQAIK